MSRRKKNCNHWKNWSWKIINHAGVDENVWFGWRINFNRWSRYIKSQSWGLEAKHFNHSPISNSFQCQPEKESWSNEQLLRCGVEQTFGRYQTWRSKTWWNARFVNWTKVIVVFGKSYIEKNQDSFAWWSHSECWYTNWWAYTIKDIRALCKLYNNSNST